MLQGDATWLWSMVRFSIVAVILIPSWDEFAAMAASMADGQSISPPRRRGVLAVPRHNLLPFTEDEPTYEDLLQLEDVRVTTSAKQLKMLPHHTFRSDSGSADQQCSICMELYEDGDRLLRLPCSHDFHKDCAEQWLGSYSKKCPICKHVLE